jgi:hypothetical protein
MTYELSPGDFVRFGNAVTLTVLAVEGDLVRFKLESLVEECTDSGSDGNLDPQQSCWEFT